jgi:hypothetical protein
MTSKPPKRQPLYPLPVEGLVRNADFIAMPAAGAGMVIRLALHFWQTECRPLPVADHELMHVCRAHAPTWRRWKASVLSAFEAIRPELEAYFGARERKATTLSNMAHARNSRRKLQAVTEAQRAGIVAPTCAFPVRQPNAPPRPPAASQRPPRPRLTDHA